MAKQLKFQSSFLSMELLPIRKSTSSARSRDVLLRLTLQKGKFSTIYLIFEYNRVALELQDRVGNKVGYQVAMESRTSPETRVLFMTTGIFLMRLVNSPESLHKYTHIIMDEVHERDLDIDFSLVVLKHLLARMQTSSTLNFKLILMSATFNTNLFANYFSKSSVAGVESMEVYVGVEEKYLKEEEAQKQKL